MALDLGALQYSLVINDEQARTDLANTSKAVDDAAEKSKSGFAKFGKAAAVIGTAVAGAVGIAVGALAKFAKDGIEYASDLSEVQNVVDTAFKGNSASVDDFAKKASAAFGMNELAAKKMSGTMGAMLSSMGLTDGQVLELSTSVTGLAGDFASFYNLDTQDAFDKIKAGISGETEPLKQLGINMSQANLEAFAMKEGLLKTTTAIDNSKEALLKIEKAQAAYNEAVKKHGKNSLEARDAQLKLDEAKAATHKTSTEQLKDLSASEQALIRYKYLMDVSKDAQGDFAKTSGSYANQQRLLQNNVQALAGTLGTALLPIFNNLIQVVNKLFESGAFDGFISMLSTTLVPALAQIGTMLADLLPSFITKVQPLFQKIISLVTNLINTIIPIILPIIEDLLPILVQIIDSVLTAIQPILPIIGQLLKALMPLITAILEPLLKLLSPIIGAVVQILTALMPPLIDIIDVLIEVINPLMDVLTVLVNLALKNVMVAFDMLKPVINGVVEHIRLMVQFFKQIFSGVFKGAFETFKDIFKNAFDTVVNFFKGWIDSIGKVAKNIWDVIGKPLEAVWNWIKDTWKKAGEFLSKPIDDAVTFIKTLIDKVKGFFTGLKIEFPKIKMPHFTITYDTKGIAATIAQALGMKGVPKLNVEWYGTGAIINQPRIIGVGEAGPEAVVPLDRLPDLLASALEKTSYGTTININNANFKDESQKQEIMRELRREIQGLQRAKGYA